MVATVTVISLIYIILYKFRNVFVCNAVFKAFPILFLQLTYNR